MNLILALLLQRVEVVVPDRREARVTYYDAAAAARAVKFLDGVKLDKSSLALKGEIGVNVSEAQEGNENIKAYVESPLQRELPADDIFPALSNVLVLKNFGTKSEADINAMFSEYGKVQSVAVRHIVTLGDKTILSSCQVGSEEGRVVYETVDDAVDALSYLHNTESDGTFIAVSFEQ